MVIRWSGGTPARFKTLSRYRRLHALSTISLVFWPHFKLSQRVIPSTWCTLTFSRYVSLTVSRSTSRSLARKERRIFLHFFGLRFIQFSSTQAAMLSRSSCIVDGKPWGSTSIEFDLESRQDQKLWKELAWAVFCRLPWGGWQVTLPVRVERQGALGNLGLEHQMLLKQKSC